jgi:hypothetical protein
MLGEKSFLKKRFMCCPTERQRSDFVTDLPASRMFDSVERDKAGIHLPVPRGSFRDGWHEDFWALAAFYG